MPKQMIPGSNLYYYLIAFDKSGNERTDDRDGLMSSNVINVVGQEQITDVFLMSHGWKGDVPAAIDQYDRWIGAMHSCADDIRKMSEKRKNFKPLYVGLHWPSLPWGDEEVGGPGSVFDVPEQGFPMERLIDEYADRIASSDRARAALRVIFESALVDAAPESLPLEVRKAYQVLDGESDMQSDGEGAAPGEDREPFDADRAYAAEQEEVMFGGGGLGGVLGPLRQLSFWKMKKRARKVGESGMHDFVVELQNSIPDGRDVRVHLMGHSFGCIVVSAILVGPDARQMLPRPVNSIVLMQGALSLWSYCSDIPQAPGRAGYFRPVIDKAAVSGPIVTTLSEFDTAVGWLYPIAAGVARQVTFDNELPKYGGLGIFGAQGPGLQIITGPLPALSEANDLQPGHIHNFDCSQFISEGGGFSGAHNDIAKPEVARLMWSAALAT